MRRREREGTKSRWTKGSTLIACIKILNQNEPSNPYLRAVQDIHNRRILDDDSGYIIQTIGGLSFTATAWLGTGERDAVGDFDASGDWEAEGHGEVLGAVKEKEGSLCKGSGGIFFLNAISPMVDSPGASIGVWRTLPH